MTCLDQIVLEDAKDRHLAMDIDREYVVMHARAITLDQLLEAFRLCGALRDKEGKEHE
jgi:hypothetical protein